MDEKKLEVKNLRLSYHDLTVLSDVNFEVYGGEVVGYLGNNGAGKSTTFKTILGLNPQYSGQIKVFGHSIDSAPHLYKKHIGYVPEQAVMYDELSPSEYLGFVGSLYGMPEAVAQARALELLNLLDMESAFHQRIDSFSKGMRQKVLIVSSLLHNPDILFLDEPLNGLDVMSVSTMKAIFKALAREGKVIFFSSHILEVVENIADRILILEAGTITVDRQLAQDDSNIEGLFHQKTAVSLQKVASDFAHLVTSYKQVGHPNV